MSANNQNEVISLLALYDYTLETKEDEYHIFESHGEYDNTSDDLDWLLGNAVAHFLQYTLGKESDAVWAALKRFNQAKTIFPHFYEDIDKMITWSAIYHDEFMKKWELDMEEEKEKGYPDDLPF